MSAGAEAGAQERARAVSTGAQASANTSESALKRLGKELLKSGIKGTMRSAIRYNVQGMVTDDWSLKGLLGAVDDQSHGRNHVRWHPAHRGARPDCSG